MPLDPRDQLRFYRLPRWTKVTLAAAAATPVVTADPSRVGLLLTGFNATNPITFATDPTVLSNGVGLVLFNQNGFAFITQNDFPGLPQQSWFGFLTPGGTIAVCEVVLQSSPEEMANVEAEFARKFRPRAKPSKQANLGLLTQADYVALLRTLSRSGYTGQRPDNGVRAGDYPGSRGGNSIPEAMGRWGRGSTSLVRSLQRGRRPG